MIQFDEWQKINHPGNIDSIARLRRADLAGDLVQKKDRPCERSKSWGGNALEGQVTRSKDLDSGRCGAIDLCK